MKSFLVRFQPSEHSASNSHFISVNIAPASYFSGNDDLPVVCPHSNKQLRVSPSPESKWGFAHLESTFSKYEAPRYTVDSSCTWHGAMMESFLITETYLYIKAEKPYLNVVCLKLPVCRSGLGEGARTWPSEYGMRIPRLWEQRVVADRIYNLLHRKT